MALVLADRVKETSTTTGTGAYTLAGAVTGFESFASIGNGNTTYYACTFGSDFEVGIGTYASSGTTLTRTTILQSSNSDNAVDWGAGTKTLFCTQPAEKAVFRDANGNVSVSGTMTATGTSVFTNLDISGNVDVDGTLEADAITLNGTSLASSATTDTTDASNINSGTLNANRLPDLTVSELAANSLTTSSESFADNDTTLMTSAAINDRIESFGYTTNTGDITGVTAGTGLSGGGSSGGVTLNVSGLTVSELAADSLTTSSESFADNDTTLMTSAAINDRIESFGYTTNTGDITGVTAGTGLSGGGNSGGVTVNLANTSVSAGSYTNTDLTVDAQGRITSASSGSSGMATSGGTFTGDVKFNDDVKAIFGTGSDMSVTHDASNTIINHTGTGDLQVQHGGNNQLVVKSTGVEIDNTLTTRGLTVTTQPKGISAFNFRYIRVTGLTIVAGDSSIFIRDLRFNTAADGTGTSYPSNMTANNAPSPYVASAVGTYTTNTNYDPWKAFDDTTNTGWWNLGNNATVENHYLQIDLGSSFNTNLNRIDITFNTSYNAGSYIIKGSSTGSFSGEETTIVSVTGRSDSTATDTHRSDQGQAFTFQMEGATTDDYEMTLAVTDPTADRTITLPNVSGTVLTTGNSDTPSTTTSSSDADFVLVDDGGTMKKITPSNLGITSGGTTAAFATAMAMVL